MEFIFELTKYNEVSFKSQVSKTLEKRTELVSRKEHPRLWSFTDKMNSKEKGSGEVLEKRRGRYMIYGVLLFFMGVFLLVTSLMSPEELKIPLIVGSLSVGIGIAYINRGRKPKIKKLTAFDRAAAKLFNEYENLPAHKVTFANENIRLEENAAISYEEIEKFFITTDFFILIWNHRITILQKKDLASHDVADFVSFISKKSQDLFEVVDII
ncbi:MAG: hypothetical protein GXY17_05990 [Clostridiaceae bacterium]|nr:hypothetical protein [Clostridiaceae bacterium]